MTPQPHIIRLRNPWQWGEDAAPGVRISRWFNRPTGLESNTRVVLAIEGGSALCAVVLNGNQLENSQPSGDTRRYDIGNRLEPRNLLELVFDALEPADRDTLGTALATGSVRLEIG